MEKLLFFVLHIFTCTFLFAGSYSDIKKFDIDSVSCFNVNLSYENITVSTCSGNNIYVISETNSKSYIPDVEVNNKELRIESSENPYESHEKGNYCEVSLMIPESFIPDNVLIKTSYGKLVVKKMNSKKVILKPGSENSLQNIKADYFEIPIPDETNINVSCLDSKEININLIFGNIKLSMLNVPEKKSRITSKFGNIYVSIPKEKSFTIDARSFNSKFINKLSDSITEWIRDGVTYRQNGGGVNLLFQTHTGDIVVE